MKRKLIWILAGILILSSFSFVEAYAVTLGTGWGWTLPGHYNPYVPGYISFGGLIEEPLAYYIRLTDDFLPRLATKWEATSTKVIVHLRQNIFWHDGTPFTSKDVVTSFLIGRLFGWDVWKYLKDVRAQDTYTVNFLLDPKQPSIFVTRWILTVRPQPDHIWGKLLPTNIRTLIARNDEKSLGTIREKVMAYRPEKPVGTGPFTLKSITTGEALLDKFPKHWQADQVKIDNVRVYRHLAAEASWASMFAGEIDYEWPGSPPTIQEEWLKRPGNKIVLPSDVSFYGLYFNCERYPLSIKEVRQALAYAIDRKEVTQVALPVGTPVDVPTGILLEVVDKWLPKDVQKDLNPYSYDPAKAESILKDLGFKKDQEGWLTPKGTRFALEIITPAGWADWARQAENVSSQLAKIGIKAEVRVIDQTPFWDRLHKGDFDIGCGWFGFWDFHPYFGFNGLFREYNGFLPPTYARPTYKGIGFGPEVEVSGVGKVNIPDTVVKLQTTKNFKDQQKLVIALAKALNEYLPGLPTLEKRLQLFYSTNRITGWPPEDNPLWYNAPGDAPSVLALMISEGYLKPAK